MQNKTIITT